MRNRLLTLLVTLVWLAACTTTPDYPNKPLAPGASNTPTPSLLSPNPNDPIILIAFSGGGSRAAAVGLGVLDELAATAYASGGRQVRMIDRIKIVSSVSGGSVVAAWFALAGPSHMNDLTTKFLSQDNMATLIGEAADPVTWGRLAFSRFTRAKALQDLLDQELFDHARFADLPPGAPLLLMNATDMESEEVFAFTPDRFNDICSDLGQLPLSVGVTASAAFPVALSPMSLKNYSYEGCTPPPATWVTPELAKLGPRYIALETYKRARYANALRNGPGAYRNEHYLHLLDGGLADNQGVHSLADALISPHGGTDLLDGINTGRARRIVVISVNAKSDADAGVGDNPAVPGLLKVINTVVGAPIDSTTALANATLEDLVASLKSAGEAAPNTPGKPKFGGMRVYGIPIDFDQFLDNQRDLQSQVKAIGTSWNLSPEQLQNSLEAGRILLRQHPCYQHLLLDMNVPLDPATRTRATTYCPFNGEQPS